MDKIFSKRLEILQAIFTCFMRIMEQLAWLKRLPWLIENFLKSVLLLKIQIITKF